MRLLQTLQTEPFQPQLRSSKFVFPVGWYFNMFSESCQHDLSKFLLHSSVNFLTCGICSSHITSFLLQSEWVYPTALHKKSIPTDSAGGNSGPHSPSTDLNVAILLIHYHSLARYLLVGLLNSFQTITLAGPEWKSWRQPKHEHEYYVEEDDILSFDTWKVCHTNIN
jgi:hypothetical protein